MSERLMSGYVAYVTPTAIAQEQNEAAVNPHPDTVSVSVSTGWSWSTIGVSILPISV